MSSIAPLSSGSAAASSIYQPPAAAPGVPPVSSAATLRAVSPVAGSQPSANSNAQAYVPGYPSNRLTIDPNFDKTIVEVLNPTTGVLVQQLPSRQAVQLYEAQGRTRGVRSA